MCLAVVGEVIELKEQGAIVDIMGNRVDIVTVMVPHVKIGDKVLIHTGFAISILDENEYAQRARIMRDVVEYADKVIQEK